MSVAGYFAKASNPKQYDLGEVSWAKEGSKNHYIRRLFLENLLQYKGSIKNKKILDVGSGSGWLSGELTSLGGKVIGIDPSSSNRLAASKLHKGIDFVDASLENYTPASKSKFDVIYCIMVFEHMPDIDLSFKKLAELLNKHGKLYVITGDFNKFTNSRFGYTVDREIIDNDVVATKTNYDKRLGTLYDINRSTKRYIDAAERHGLYLDIYQPIRPPDWLLKEQSKYSEFVGHSLFHMYIFSKHS